MSERVGVQIEDHVATVSLRRAEKHNALDAPMFSALLDAAAAVRVDPSVRAVVLHGEGPSFCSGLDVAALAAQGGLADGELLTRAEGQRSNTAQRVSTDWADLPVPVIAAVHGNCLGGGAQIALGADLRICAPDARLSIREVHWGLVPDMGISATLPRLLPHDVAIELALTGRILTAEEAHGLGLVTRLADDPLAAAHELARELAMRSPDAVRAIKRLFERAYLHGPQLELETELQRALLASQNHRIAVEAGLRGEVPTFVDASASPDTGTT